jgi:hypothetical protein
LKIGHFGWIFKLLLKPSRLCFGRERIDST